MLLLTMNSALSVDLNLFDSIFVNNLVSGCDFWTEVLN